MAVFLLSVILVSSFSLTSQLQNDFKRADLNEMDAWQGRYNVDSDSAELVIGVEGFSECPRELSSLIIAKGGIIVNSVEIGDSIAVVVDVPLKLLSVFASEAYTLDFVEYIEPNLKYRLTFTPNDQQWDLQWGLQKIQADWAWNKTIGNLSVTVSVLDTGIDWNHPDLAENYVPLGYDWVNNDNDTIDDNGHGTHCAGIIAAEVNNGIGVAGLAQVKLMVEKCFNSTGSGNEDDCANAIIHAVDQGAKILSLSWGDYEDSSLIRDAIEYAYNQGVLIVAAAGNDHISEKVYPAAYDEVIAVTATTQSDRPAVFSNFGDWVELAAPGVSIYSTYPDDSYTFLYGTSMACPHVAGVAALVWSRFPNMTRDEVRFQLRKTVDDLGVVGFDDYYGYGRINARKALIDFSHDLSVSLEAPKSVLLGKGAALNVTIFDKGKYNESNVEVQLLINGTVEHSQILSDVILNSSERFSYTWLPEEGTFTVTAYIPPIPEEESFGDNVVSQGVVVRPELIRPKPGDYANYKVEVSENATVKSGELNFSYTELSNEQFIKTHVDSRNVSGIEDGTISITIDAVTRLVENGPQWWVDTYYFELVEAVIDVEDSVDLFKGRGTVIGEYNVTINEKNYRTWLIAYSGETTAFNNFTSHHCYFDKATGTLVKWASDNTTLPLDDPEKNYPFTMFLTETNIDATPPSIAITNPKQGSIFTNTTITIKWSANDNETGIDKFSVYLNHLFIENTTQSYFILSDMAEGLNSIEVVAFDKAGNNASDQTTITVDTSSPTVNILYPSTGFTTNKTSIEVTWMGTDNETAIANYVLYINGIFAANTTSTTTILTDIEEGENDIMVVASDLAGNKENATITILVDRTLPEVSTIYPKENSTMRGIVFISFEVSQDTVQTLLFIDNSMFDVTDGSTYRWDTTQVEDGEHSIRILAIDRAGNIGIKTIATTIANEMLTEGLSYILAVVAIVVSIFVISILAASTFLFKRFRSEQRR